MRPALLLLLGVALAANPAAAGHGRERAVELIPELMGRILESQEEIREHDRKMATQVERFDERLDDSREAIEAARSEDQAAEALVDYIEAYASRLDEQHAGLIAIEESVTRMRGDARELARIAEVTKHPEYTRKERREFFADHYQGIAAGTGELAKRLGRNNEAASVGSVLRASWSLHGGLELPIPEMGPEGAIAFARQVDGLYARVQARSNQLRVERRSVRHLLDVLIERRLADRLDQLFAEGTTTSLGALLAGDGGGADWEDLNHLVHRTLGLPDGARSYSRPGDTSFDRLDYFAHGAHRD
jgi:hypothetical protein